MDSNAAITRAPFTTWHFCWQAAIGREFFPDAELRVRVRDRLIDAHRRRDRILVDYCLLQTEIHLIAHLAEGDDPGDVARAIGNVISRWVRQAVALRSPVLAGPFRAHRIESEEALRQEIRMLAWRPVEIENCRSPMLHIDGALRTALGRRPADGFDSRAMLAPFGDTVIGARQALRRWILRRPSNADWRIWELARGLRLAQSHVGPQPRSAWAVKNAEAAALIAAAGGDGVDDALDLLTVWVTAKLGGRHAVDLRAGTDRASARGRALVARLAMEKQLCSSASAARFFGRSKATLSEQVVASRTRAVDQEIVSTPAARIISEYGALVAAAGDSS